MRRELLPACAIVTALCVSACGSDSSGGTTTEPPSVFTMKALARAEATATIDAAVATRPSVVIEDASGKKKAGVPVTFTVVAGGGTVTGGTATTDGSGVAAVGGWTMGPTPTANILEATAEGFPPVRFTVDALWGRRLAATDAGACAITTRLYCWGDNSHAEFGAGPTGDAFSATPVAAGSGASSVAQLSTGNGQHYCGMTATGDGVCWGRGNLGQLGNGVVGAAANIPVSVVGTPWSQLSTSRITSCGIRSSSAYCWGANQSGEIGATSAPISGALMFPTPLQVTATMSFRAISAGWMHACGIAQDSVAYCWGNNRQGQAGTATTDTIVRGPTRVAGTDKFVVLSTGARHSCGITADGRALCWGENSYGQLGDGTMVQRRAPTPVAGNLRFTAIVAAGMYVMGAPVGSGPAAGAAGHTCALTETGQPYCWGWNAWGQLGDGTTTDRLQPTPVSGTLRLSGLALGEGHTCGMRGTSVWCWGANQLGQVGDGTTLATTRQLPVRVALP